MRLHVHRWADGPRVVLLHGSVLGGERAWRVPDAGDPFNRRLERLWTT